MRVHTPTVVRPAPLRSASRASRRGISDSRALLLAILGGLTLAFYVHDPATFEARLRQSQATIQEVASWFTPTHFQAALTNLTKSD